MHALLGGPFDTEKTPPAMVAQMEAIFGLSRPLHEQYFVWLPNVLGPLIVAETLAIPTYIYTDIYTDIYTGIYTEAFLSFIGLGVQPPMASWGGMISDAYGALRSAPHLILFAALALCLTILAFSFLGDAIGDAIDPKMRQ